MDADILFVNETKMKLFGVTKKAPIAVAAR